MKLLIAIPSKGRPYKCKTYKWLSKCNLPANVDYRFIVEPQERIYYEQSIGKEKLLTLKENDKGYAYAIDEGHKYAKENSYDIIWQMDDDVLAFIDKRAKAKHTSEVFEKIVVDLIDAFKHDDKLGIVRFLSQRAFYFIKNELKRFVYKNQGGWGNFLIRTKCYAMEQGWKTHSDTMQHIKVWEQGYYTKTYGLAGINAEVYTNEGGYQMLNRKHLTEETLKYLKKDYPLMEWQESNNTLGYDIKTDMYRPKKEKL
tara:strand:- start:3672 stop:4439 length:768 start_codon:yes stop_codon:yes gene_type:complete